MPGRPVVRVVDAAAAVEEDLRVVGQHRVRPELADLADQQLAERQLVGERAVRLVEEPDVVIADDGGRRRCSASRVAASSSGSMLGVLAALVAARAADEAADRARVDPAGRRRGRPEVRIVGVRDDQHEPRGARQSWRRDDRPGRRGGSGVIAPRREARPPAQRTERPIAPTSSGRSRSTAGSLPRRARQLSGRPRFRRRQGPRERRRRDLRA